MRIAADDLLSWLLGTFADAAAGLKNERGGIVRAGTGSAMYYIFHAQELGATADGREAGVPLPANYSPSLNIRLNGPVSLIKSFSKPDLGRTINGGPLTIEFSESVFTQEESITKVAQLVSCLCSARTPAAAEYRKPRPAAGRPGTSRKLPQPDCARVGMERILCRIGQMLSGPYYPPDGAADLI